jgi:hypothetical protein
MATMIPDDIQEFTTPGEGVFYRFLRACAKPDVSYIAWYQPDIAGREPDFILYAQDAGLIIFEVKDWALDQIVAPIPNSSPFISKGKRSRVRTLSSRSGSTSARSLTRSKETAIWCRKMHILMARSR